MSDEVVRETWLSANKSNERAEFHVLFDDFEVFFTDSFDAESIANDEEDMVHPGQLLGDFTSIGVIWYLRSLALDPTDA